MPEKRIPDSRALEKMTSHLARLLEEKNFSSKKGLEDYLNAIYDF